MTGFLVYTHNLDHISGGSRNLRGGGQECFLDILIGDHIPKTKLIVNIERGSIVLRAFARLAFTKAHTNPT